MLLVGGHSGAGKSTLLKLVAGIEKSTSGAVLVGGQNLGSLAPSALPYYRRRIGMVFQDQKLLFDRSVFENVMLPCRYPAFRRAKPGSRVRAALDKVGLGKREKALPVMLSGGEQQRLAIARAVVGRPDLLLADEPTAHLDAGHRPRCCPHIPRIQSGRRHAAGRHLCARTVSRGRTARPRSWAAGRMNAWLSHHRRSAALAWRRIASTPVNSLLSLLAIGIALALPAGGQMLLSAARQLAGNGERHAADFGVHGRYADRADGGTMFARACSISPASNSFNSLPARKPWRA
jgi:ABC-type uncharacterized transport system YnjBCD ATPase subunit